MTSWHRTLLSTGTSVSFTVLHSSYHISTSYILNMVRNLMCWTSVGAN